ncbi:hypothetical protein FIBSPDRAFT_1045789 [Athelia psychrophila]|uniref:BTB domain-containing protein n=1 Tax=Athelia psychrophila TaxID=1759441 RepID=A0A166HMY5_9AGAM|nr:hypothetical protein FIBSPDRAFT_1045789 [Fibularhizoctonia sp. CBS 109695]
MSSENRSNPGDHIDLVRSDVWYDDGNVVLQAQNAQFKIHKSILVHSSAVFRDMLSLPQPPLEDTYVVDGCPVVHLSDSAEEVRYILQAIFQRKYVADEEKIPFAVMSAFLSLGGKYNIPKLRTEATKKLYREFPINLRDMDALGKAWATIDTSEVKNEYMELVILARRERVLSVLPSLLYQCCKCYSVSEILQGLVRNNGSPLLLSPEDQLACLAGHRKLCEAQTKTTFDWAFGAFTSQDITSRKCRSSIQCDHARRQFLSTARLYPVSDVRGLIRWRDSFSKGLCATCAIKAKEHHNMGRAKFWERLPVLLGLPPWSELKKEREEV